ncbi:MAG TPA: pyridoxamine 5'-phosphate oxidase family protein [Acidimicrobiales bacterium]|nr:pyridoxamine 5'-phosphate oxidase family protein [Acidimicrobiales bacterium]
MGESDHYEELSATECWRLLAARSLGRIAVTVAALPVVLPVFYAVLDESIVFRTPPRTRLAAATTRAVVAFQIDDFADETGKGWSVMAQGVASSITAPDRIEQARELPLDPMTEHPDEDRFVSVRVGNLSGLRFTRSGRRPRTGSPLTTDDGAAHDGVAHHR